MSAWEGSAQQEAAARSAAAQCGRPQPPGWRCTRGPHPNGGPCALVDERPTPPAKHFAPGLYRHYKGGLYLALAVAETHEHNGDLDVVYVSLTHGHHVTRPLWRDSRNQDSWADPIVWPDGQTRARFIPEDRK